jgi:hypothetical protein
MVFERRRIRRVGETSSYAEGQEAEVGNEERIIEMIEFSCPYGYISRGQDTLKRVYEEKKRKYQRLAMNLKQRRRSEVRITAVVVSIMGGSLQSITERFTESARMHRPETAKAREEDVRNSNHGSIEI